MTSRHDLLHRAAGHVETYLDTVADRPVRATATSGELRAILGAPLADDGEDPAGVLEALAGAGREGTAATQGPRFFGFVTGGSLPMATAADWLVSGWDQNAAGYVMSPLVAVIERIQEEGTCWCGGTEWQGRTAMRICVSSWTTTDEDVERSLDAMLRIVADNT